MTRRAADDDWDAGADSPVDVTTRLGLDPWLGRTLAGRYRIESLLGAGGYGAVYEATQLSVDRRVAVKLLHPAAAESPVEEQRFIREAQALSRLSHPNIVQLIDFGRTDVGHTYLVSELIRGPSLDKLLRRDGAFAPRRTARLIDQTLSALTEAHEHGIVHRDLKPANLMVTTLRDGSESVKLIDFGIARSNDLGQPGLTQATSILGTPRFLAPERWMGEAADERTDLYALGLIAHELLTGQPAIGGDVVDCREAHLTGTIPALPDHVPLALRRFVAECTAISPTSRPAAARDARARLVEFVSGDVALGFEQAPSSQTLTVERTRDFSRDHGPTSTGTTASWRRGGWLMVALLVIASAAAIMWSVRGADEHAPADVIPPSSSTSDPAKGPASLTTAPARLSSEAIAPAQPMAVPRQSLATPPAKGEQRSTITRRWLDTEPIRLERAPIATTSDLVRLEWTLRVAVPGATLFGPDGSLVPGPAPWRIEGTRYSNDRVFTVTARGHQPVSVLVGPSITPGERSIELPRARAQRPRPVAKPLDTPLELKEEPIDVPL